MRKGSNNNINNAYDGHSNDIIKKAISARMEKLREDTERR